MINASESQHANVDFAGGNIVLNIALMSRNTIMANVTLSSTNATAPKNYSKIFVFYLNVSSTAMAVINVTLRYNCSINPELIAPFYLSNGTWQPIYTSVILPGRCTISFKAPNQRTIGIFEALSAPVQPTTTVQSTEAKQAYAGIYYASGFAVLIVIAVAVYLLMLRKGRQSKDKGT